MFCCFDNNALHLLFLFAEAMKGRVKNDPIPTNNLHF